MSEPLRDVPTMRDVRPWQMIPEEYREFVLRQLAFFSSENPRADKTPPPEPWMQEIHDAALSVLRDVYPDDAPVFSLSAELDSSQKHVELIFWTDRPGTTPLAEVRFGSGEVSNYDAAWLEPLTPAAVDMLSVIMPAKETP
jgi:hypothetical protein